MVYSLVVRARGLEYGGPEFKFQSLRLQISLQISHIHINSYDYHGLKTICKLCILRPFQCVDIVPAFQKCVDTTPIPT